MRVNQPGDTTMDEHELTREDGDGWELIGEFSTYKAAVAAALEDSLEEEPAFGTTVYADCGIFEIRVEVDPDDNLAPSWYRLDGSTHIGGHDDGRA